MQLVLLPLQIVEKPTNPAEASVPNEHEVLLFFGQLPPRNIEWQAERHSRILGQLLHLVVVDAMLRFGPRLNRSLGKSFRLVWDHQIHIEINGVTESLATRARSVWIV